MRTIDDVIGRLEVTEAAHTEYLRARSEVIRTGVHDPEVDALRAEIVAAVRELVTAWELIGEPEDIGTRLRSLPEFETSRIAAYVDPETTKEFESLTSAEPRPEWDDGPADDDDALMIPLSWSDAHVAEALAEHLRGSWLYVAAWSRWLRWDGRRWATDDREGVFEVARQWCVNLVSHLAQIGASDTDLKRCGSYRNRNKLESALIMARRIDGIAESVAAFDTDPDRLNVRNGVVDLRTGVLKPHDPDARITKLADVDYVPGATHEDVVAVTGVVSDDVRPYVQRLLGYGATGHVSEDVAAVWGGGGGNGKSALLEAAGTVLGEYAGAVSPQLVMRTSHEPHPTIKADLLGKRLVWISETEEGGAFRMEQVKSLTGGDQISARFMRGDFFTFKPTHALIIATNHRPNVNSTEHAAWRRLRLIPFPFTYKPVGEVRDGDRAQDHHLRHRLATGQAQREAMLAWIVAGAGNWYRIGLGTSAEVDAATRAWRSSEDVVLRFIEECITFDMHARTRGRDLYVAYCDWCSSEGRKPKSNKNFAQEFMAHETVVSNDITTTRPQGQVHYAGVEIRSNSGI